MPDHDLLLKRIQKDLNSNAERYVLEDIVNFDPVIARAKDTLTESVVLIKQQVLDFNEQDRKEVEREIKSLETIQHENVIKLYDHIFVRGKKTVYQVMEAFERQTLAEYVESLTFNNSTFSKYLELTRQLLEGIRAIHDKNIIHRDLKPRNILVREGPNGIELKIVDFGLSVKNHTLYSKTYGTPGYLAPEVKTGATADQRTDLFSAGIILHELFSGGLRQGTSTEASLLSSKLSNAKNEEELKKLCVTNPQTLTETPENYRGALAKIINKLTNHAHPERYSEVRAPLLDFQLLTQPEKIKTIEQALAGDPHYAMLDHAAAAFIAARTAQFQSPHIIPVLFDDVHAKFDVQLQFFIGGAFSHYINMLEEKNAPDQEKKAIAELTGFSYDSLKLFATKIRVPAEHIVSNMEKISPQGRALWNQLKHQHPSFEIALDHAKRAAHYAAEHSADACAARGYELLGNLAPIVPEGILWKQDPEKVALAEKEFENALAKQPDHAQASAGIILAKLFLANEDSKKGIDTRISALLDPTKKQCTSLSAQQRLFADNIRENAYLAAGNENGKMRALLHVLRRLDHTRERSDLEQRLLVSRALTYLLDLNPHADANTPNMTKLCTKYVDVCAKTSAALELPSVLLVKAHHYLKNWQSAVQTAAARIALTPTDTVMRAYLEDSLRQMHIDEIVADFSKQHHVDVRPLFQFELIEDFTSVPKIERAAIAFSKEYRRVKETLSTKYLDELVTRMSPYDPARADRIKNNLRRDRASSYYIAPALAPPKKSWFTRLLDYLSPYQR